VELTIHRNLEETSAKFVDQIPEGYTASVIDAHSGQFSFENQEASFAWSTLPADSSFTISYLVRAIKAGPAPVIQGMLLYGDSAGEETATATKTATENPDKNAELIVDEMIAGENEKPSAPAVEASVNPVSSMSSPVAGGTYYKVQICATRKSTTRESTWFRKKYKITDPVDLTMHDGWKKYLIGNFSSYSDAKSYRKTTQTLVPDAFVVAYVDGQRTPLSTAIHRGRLNQ